MSGPARVLPITLFVGVGDVMRALGISRSLAYEHQRNLPSRLAGARAACVAHIVSHAGTHDAGVTGVAERAAGLAAGRLVEDTGGAVEIRVGVRIRGRHGILGTRSQHDDERSPEDRPHGPILPPDGLRRPGGEQCLLLMRELRALSFTLGPSGGERTWPDRGPGGRPKWGYPVVWGRGRFVLTRVTLASKRGAEAPESREPWERWKRISRICPQSPAG